MAKLSKKKRNLLSGSEFVYPRLRKYPIPDIQHARAALARVQEWGTPSEKERVRKAVLARFPSIKIRGSKYRSAVASFGAVVVNDARGSEDCIGCSREFFNGSPGAVEDKCCA